MPETCDMGFCDEPVVEHIAAFENSEERGYCTEHAEVARAWVEANPPEQDTPSWDDYVNNRGPVWSKDQDGPPKDMSLDELKARIRESIAPDVETDGVTCHWCHKACGGTCLGVNNESGPRQMKPSDPAYFLLADGHTSTPEVHRDGCYICSDPEFAEMGLPLCKACPKCSAEKGEPAGHVPADDEECDDCGTNLRVLWEMEQGTG